MKIKKKKDIWFVCFLGTLCIRAEEKKVKEKILNCDFKWLHTADKSLALVHLNGGGGGHQEEERMQAKLTIPNTSEQIDTV